MTAEIIGIGSELVLGITVDTNSAYIARHMATMGIAVARVQIVGDDVTAIATAMRQAIERADCVICTGGLGPTIDDKTREAAAHALNRPLEFRPSLLAQIRARFAAMQRPMSENNRVQAYVPAGCRVLPNEYGTAPAFLVETETATLVVLPGVPFEMRALLHETVLPYLRDERGQTHTTLVQTLHIVGLGESSIGERIADVMQHEVPAVGTSARLGRCEVRVSATAPTENAATALIEPTVAVIQERLGNYCVGKEPLATIVARLLQQQQSTLAIYEGGMPTSPLLHMLEDHTAIRGSMAMPNATPPQPNTDEHNLITYAQQQTMMVRDYWQTDNAIGAHAMPHHNEHGFTQVAIILITPHGITHHTRALDVRRPEVWEFVSNSALELLYTALTTP